MEKMDIKNLIRTKLIEIHKTCTTDQYGQMGTYNLGLKSIFGKDAEMVADFVQDNKSIIEISTCGGRGGIYKSVSKIIDHEIKLACDEAFRLNENRLENLRGW